MNNLMDMYINFTENKIKKYIKTILGKYYHEDVTNEYLKTYINARYYNITNVEKKARAFYLRIMNELENKEKIINEKIDLFNIEDTRVIIYTKKIFESILFFDNVRKVDNFKNIESIREIVKNLVDIREEGFDLKSSEEFEEKLYNEIVDDMISKEVFLEKFEDDDFELEIEKHKENDQLYYVYMSHNIKMPEQYSEKAVEKVYNSGIIAEDKLEIEYILTSIIAIRDIIEGNFDDKYIVEFTISLINKKQKMLSILSRLNNQALQEKINLNIMYEDYKKYKKKINELIKLGYHFVITLDSSVKSIEEVEELRVFEYVILPEKIEMYKEILKNRKILKNVIKS